MEALKDKYFNKAFYKRLSQQFAQVYPDFKPTAFYTAAIQGLESLELKQRITHTTDLSAQYLPSNYIDALKVLYALSEIIEEDFPYLFMPDYVARYGQDHYRESMQALRDFTEYSSSELAIRIFLQNRLKDTMKFAYQWAEDDRYHVRRLASEGTRPRLPWALRVKALYEDPKIAFPILETLKADKEKYVQKSVANHINDISKGHADWVVGKIKKWPGINKDTDWVVKHGLRGLIKAGHPKAMSLIGVKQNADIKLVSFKLDKNKISLGDKLGFNCKLRLDDKKPHKLVIDYKIYFVKKNGCLSPKVFKLKTIKVDSNDHIEISKQHLFKDYTTRKHHAGLHKIQLMVNGNTLAEKSFRLFI